MSKSIDYVNTSSVFLENSEVYYSIRKTVCTNDYPQVHDFYEFILMTDNQMDILLNNDLYHLKSGDLILIRPGVVHTKIETTAAVHINLAFPALTVNALFQYLYGSEPMLCDLLAAPHIPVVHLTTLDTRLVMQRLSDLNRLSASSTQVRNTHLRAILIDLIYTHLMPAFLHQQKQTKDRSLPPWLTIVTEGLSEPQNMIAGMDYILKETRLSEAHICRSFKKHLGMTPSAFINGRKLNYAVNLLMHSDLEIIDIIFESGFQSVNYFYHLFKKEYGMSPLQYKKNKSSHAL